MEGICTVNKSKDDDLEWVIFNEKFNNCLTIEILQFFLSHIDSPPFKIVILSSS
mgnify:CR=1 FL=1